MFHRRLLVSSFWRQKFSTSCLREVKVAVLGAAGGIGQPLSLLLKLSPKEVTGLVLYDIKHVVGVATDVSHIDSNSSAKGFSGPESLTCALESMEVVVILAGVPRIPGRSPGQWSRDDLFDVNASVVRDLLEACSTVCPQALIAIITNPVNSVVPIAAEVLKKHGVFDSRRLFGVTTIDLLRASTFVGNLRGKDPRKVSIPCIGGHSGSNIIPLLSQCKPKLEFKDEEVVALTKRIQIAGPEVVKAKDGAGSATLSMAYAAHRFVISLCRGLMGESEVVECAYVNSNLTEATFFSSPVLLGRCGIEKIYPLPPLSKYENELLKAAVPELKKNIKKGEDFMCQ